MISFFQSFLSDPDRFQEGGDRVGIEAEGTSDLDGWKFPLLDQAIDRHRRDGQPFGQLLHGIELISLHASFPYMARMAASMSASLKLKYWTVELMFLCPRAFCVLKISLSSAS